MNPKLEPLALIGQLEDTLDKLYVNETIDLQQRNSLSSTIASLIIAVRSLMKPGTMEMSSHGEEKLQKLVESVNKLVTNLSNRPSPQIRNITASNGTNTKDDYDSEFEDDKDCYFRFKPENLVTPTKQGDFSNLNFNRDVVNFTTLNTPGLNQRPSLKEGYASSDSFVRYKGLKNDIFID